MVGRRNNARSFSATMASVGELLGHYSPEDIAIALCASSMWLPNIAAPMKHLVWAAIFASMKADAFRGEQQISSYGDFRSFIDRLYPALPQLPQMEDYIPEPDWGDVRFHHQGSDYKIFYGCEIGNIYDWLMAFQVMYCSLDRAYVECSKRSPTDELRQCLKLQDYIIAHIDAQPNPEAMGLTPGHIEPPSEEFWQNVRTFCRNCHPEQQVSRAFLDLYSTSLGSLDLAEPSVFYEAAFSGTVLPFFFITHAGRYFPLLPRRYSPILTDRWAHVFSSFRGQLDHDGAYLMKLNAEICLFLKKRIDQKSQFRFTSPVDASGQPDRMLFASAILAGDRLILIHVLPPFTTADELQLALNEVAPRMERAIAMIATPPVTLALNLDRKTVQLVQEHGTDKLQPFPIVVLCPATTEVVPVAVPESPADLMVLFLDQFLAIMDEVEHPGELSEFIDYLGDVDTKISVPFISPLDKYGSFKDSSGVLLAGARDPDWIAIDPQWGSNYRYKSLAKFWRLFPKTGFFDHPRSWKVEQESPTRIRLVARGYFGCALYLEIGSCAFFTNAPFDAMTYEQG